MPYSAIHRCIRDDDLEGLNSLIAEGVDVNGIKSTGQTPLHYASSNGHLESCLHQVQR